MTVHLASLVDPESGHESHGRLGRVALNATVPLRLRDSGHRNTRLPLEALSGRLGTFPGPGPTDCAFRPTRIQEFFAKRYSRRGGIDEDLASFCRGRWEFASMMRVSCR